MDWRQTAFLCLHDADQDDQATRLFWGNLLDTIIFALARPVAEQPRLMIVLSKTEQKLDWPEIKAISDRDDFPILI